MCIECLGERHVGFADPALHVPCPYAMSPSRGLLRARARSSLQMRSDVVNSTTWDWKLSAERRASAKASHADANAVTRGCIFRERISRCELREAVM
jgi:hypothetical protein